MVATVQYLWPEEALTLLRAEYAKGTTDRVIVGLLPHDANGHKPSVGAVVGKRYRMGLKGQSPGYGKVQAVEAARQARVALRKATKAAPDEKNAPTAKSGRTRVSPTKLLAKHDGPHLNLVEEATPFPLTAALDLFNATIPKAQRKTIVQLDEVTCRWPVGDVGEDGFFFCGREATGGGPYCAEHRHFSRMATQVAYQNGCGRARPISVGTRGRNAASGTQSSENL